MEHAQNAVDGAIYFSVNDRIDLSFDHIFLLQFVQVLETAQL